MLLFIYFKKVMTWVENNCHIKYNKRGILLIVCEKWWLLDKVILTLTK